MWGKLMYKFKILYSGWEYDDDGWVYEKEDGERILVLTNHGKEYVANINELQSKIVEYKEAIIQTQIAINILEHQED